MDLEERDKGINLTCISQEYNSKTVSNLDLTNPVCMHPLMLSVEGETHCYQGSELISRNIYCLLFFVCRLHVARQNSSSFMTKLYL